MVIRPLSERKLLLRSLISFNTFYDKARIRVSNPQDPFPSFSAEQNFGKSISSIPPIAEMQVVSVVVSQKALFRCLLVSNNGLDKTTTSDQGIDAKNGNDNDLGKFEPPSLQDISIRAPFMYDGRFETLEEVIDHYSTGIKDHPNLGGSLKDKT
ncbi:MAG: hypothetical protein GY761_13870 [Hyphomicrobiales bacterium]|nr:hypothetical protein [Hyphomicrobiales bacterium]